MCACGHKKKLHSSAKTGASAVNYPCYWEASGEDWKDGSEFNSLVQVESEDMVKRFQELLKTTYSNVTTRDRCRHCNTWKVPRGYKLVSVHRNENSRLWRSYCIRKAELQKQREEEKREKKELGAVYDDVLTTKAVIRWSKDYDLDPGINEWYLFHGSSFAAAKNICSTSFKMRLAGSSTGTLYGRGSYLAESITKADEYAKEEDGVFTVLLNRVLGGRVRYCEAKTPDPEALTKECVEGSFDCILGDRLKVCGTYREFVVFDSEGAYPEYVINYTRR
jgi:hypothetical protein